MREVTSFHQGVFMIAFVFSLATGKLYSDMVENRGTGLRIHSSLTSTEQNMLRHQTIARENKENNRSQITLLHESNSNYAPPLLHYTDANLSTINNSWVLQACDDVIPDVKKAQYHTNWCHIVIVNTAFSEMLDKGTETCRTVVK